VSHRTKYTVSHLKNKAQALQIPKFIQGNFLVQEMISFVVHCLTAFNRAYFLASFLCPWWKRLATTQSVSLKYFAIERTSMMCKDFQVLSKFRRRILRVHFGVSPSVKLQLTNEPKMTEIKIISATRRPLIVLGYPFLSTDDHFNSFSSNVGDWFK
jgi:hypothetical protein